jgi:penicillin-binding protein 2
MYNLRERRLVLLAIFSLVFFAYAGRLFFLQIISSDYASKADENAIKKRILQPARGVIYDREGRIIVTNIPIFELYITPRELRIPDTTILERYLSLDRGTIQQRIKAAKSYSPIKASLFEKQISADRFTRLEEHLWQFEGIESNVRNTRIYMYPVAGHLLGYINEVDKNMIKNSGGYYQLADLVGRTGVERNYESWLRGQKGVKMSLEDVHGREIGPFSEGRFDTLPKKGQDLVLSIDAELQAFGEELMQNKVGSVVAIEPSTGEILAYISGPTYDPNLLTGPEFTRNFTMLQRDTLKPLFNRPIMARYPPGSIFKVLNALIAMQEGTASAGTTYGCAGGFARNGGRPKCHAHGGPLNMEGAITNSCNAYFAGLYVDFLHNDKFANFNIAYNTWYKYMKLCGVGQQTGVDMPNEKAGLLPNQAFYDKWYGSNRWKGMTIVSNAIGQGEILMTPLQMANVTAMVANRGYYIKPHFLKSYFGQPANKQPTFERVNIPIDKQHFDLVVNGMEQVVAGGTGYMARIDGISMCGKTGTAENTHGKDHSVFIGFAPKDNPKIAIAIILENAGWGGEWAAPMAGIIMGKYLKKEGIDSDYRVEYLKKGNFLPAGYRIPYYPPSFKGKPTLNPAVKPDARAQAEPAKQGPTAVRNASPSQRKPIAALPRSMQYALRAEVPTFAVRRERS